MNQEKSLITLLSCLIFVIPSISYFLTAFARMLLKF